MTITNAKFLVKYTGSPTPTSDTAVAKSLKGAGPLTIGALHALNELLPDVVEDDSAGDYTITLQALDDLLERDVRIVTIGIFASESFCVSDFARATIRSDAAE
jgi:hypothetical protein